MSRQSSFSLRIRLLLIVLLAMLPVLGLLLYSNQEQRRFAISLASEQTLKVARLVSASQVALIEQTHQFLSTLGQLPQIRLGMEPCSAFLQSLQKEYPYYAVINVSRPADGEVICSTLPLPDNVAGQGFFQRTLATGSFTVGDYTLGGAAGRPFLPLSYPVFTEEGLEMVLTAGVDLSWLNRLAASASPANSVILVVDRQGTVLAYYPESSTWTGRNVAGAPVVQLMLGPEREGAAIIAGLQDSERLFAYTPLVEGDDPSSAVLAVGLPLEEAYAEANRLLWTNLAILGVVTTVALAAAWVVGNEFIVQPVNRLIAVTRRLAAGDLQARTDIVGSSEVGQLARAFDEMANSLQRQINQRIEAESESRRYAARTLMLIQVADQLNARLDLPLVLRMLCELAARAFNVTGSLVLLYDEGEDHFYYAAGYGLPAHALSKVQPAPGDSYRQFIETYDLPIVASDTRKLTPLVSSELCQEHDIRTTVTARIAHHQQILGVLVIFTVGESRGFTEEEVGLLGGIAGQAALAINNARLFDQLHASREQLRQLAQQLVNVQEKERRHVARELHDQAGQVLVALKITMQGLEASVPEEMTELQQSFQEALGLVDMVMDDIRSLTRDLRPLVVEMRDINATLEGMCREFSQHIQLPIHYSGQHLPELADSLSLTLYRFLQESLTNAAKHAQASHIWVTMKSEDEEVSIAVEDDGVGFETANRWSTGIGLVGMQERIEMMGGVLVIDSQPGRGTSLVATLPYQEADGNVGV
ncbi:MAG: histidine kinase [Chloroflexi bacterium]|nr:histidine kinase [Chloroflexota bacterium]MCI0577495.1 histidine kinase [Chloroflexota bacterium]MCI0647686.1 histidine kinase [Chloroflexota bacterium]MCI0730116.1 histidine kinase [Chloroflexota bacterium]